MRLDTTAPNRTPPQEKAATVRGKPWYLPFLPEMLQPPSPGSFVWFSLICSRRDGSTAAVVTLDTVVDESRKKMADSVTRSTARLGFEAETGSIVTMDALNTFSLLLCLASCWYQVLVPISPSLSGMFLLFVFLALCSGHLLRTLSNSYDKCSCVIRILPHLGIALFLFVWYFFVVLNSWVAFLFCSLSYPVR